MRGFWRKKAAATVIVANDNEEVFKPEAPRSSERRPIYREAFLHLPEGVRIKVTAMDISPLGARVRVVRSEPLSPVMEVSISGEVVRQRAQVVWRDKGDIGLEYLNPNLSKEALVDLLMKLEGYDAEI